MTSSSDLDRLRKFKADEHQRLLELSGWSEPLSLTQRERLRWAVLCSMQAQRLEARMMTGKAVDTAQLMTCQQAVVNILPEQRMIMEVEYVDKTLCPKCFEANGRTINDPDAPGAYADPAAQQKRLPAPEFPGADVIEPALECEQADNAKPVQPAAPAELRIDPPPLPPIAASVYGPSGDGGAGFSRFDNNR